MSTRKRCLESDYIPVNGFRVRSRDELLEYLNSPPLDVPPDYNPNEAFKRGVETKDWSLLETAARKVCRLMIESAKKSFTVRRWLLATRRVGSQEWNKLMVSIGRETPDMAGEISKLKPSVEMLSWAVANAIKVIKEEGQTENW